MPRRPGLQFPNACYHVINRGNYRSDVFANPRTKAVFEACLFEACKRFGWVLYAYVIMRNHFHLAVCTPRPNLAAGMQWLETTFATRFNRFRREHGHLFQGRYRAPLLELGETVARVINYIHLNPVRAKVVTAGQLAGYRHGSFHWFGSRRRLAFMPRSECLRGMGLGDDAVGWRTYRECLVWLAADPAEQKRQAWNELSKGTAIGSLGWRRSIRARHRLKLGRHLFSREENLRLDHQEWSQALAAALKSARKTLVAAKTSPKGTSWKLKIARELRATTSVTVPWLAHALHMGSASGLRALLARNKT